MVSIDYAKRYMIDNDLDLPNKKKRLSTQSEISNILSLHSSRHTENLSRLRIIFPFMPAEELSKILEASSDSFEYAVLSIQKQEKRKIAKASLRRRAEELVMALTSVQNIQEAVEIAGNYLENAKFSDKKREISNENSALTNHIEELTKQNKMLKRAICKLHDTVGECALKDQLNEKLAKELENERIKNYSLVLQLKQGDSKTKFIPNRDLF